MSLATLPPEDPAHHVAQVNVARLLAPLESPLLRGFVDRLEEINALADASPGFVWRLQTEAGDATSIRAFDDDLVIVNLSVWRSLPALWEFVYASRHLDVLRRRREWFERMPKAHLALWWLSAGTLPSLEEAKQRVERLRRDGPGPEAFTFRAPWPPPWLLDSGRPGERAPSQMATTPPQNPGGPEIAGYTRMPSPG